MQQPQSHPIRHKQQQFESFSEQSNSQTQKQKNRQQQNTKNYTLSTIVFPQPQPKTLQLYSLYQKNYKLIQKLRNKISELEQLKRNNIYISVKADLPSVVIDAQEVSEFFIKSQQLYLERQRQLNKLKNQYKFANSEQMQTVMLKNLNINKIANQYFENFRHVIEAKAYDQAIILLASQKRLNKCKKSDKYVSLNKQLRKTQTAKKRSQSNDSGSQQKIKGSRLRSTSKNTKSNEKKSRHRYCLHFIDYLQVFSEFQQKDNKKIPKSLSNVKIPINIEEPLQFQISQDNSPYRQIMKMAQNFIISFTYDSYNQNILLLTHNGIFIYHLVKTDKLNSSNKGGKNIKKQQQAYLLVQLELKILLDNHVKVCLCQMKKNLLYIVTNDGIVRIYQTELDQNKKFKQYKLIKILSCLGSKVVSIDCAGFSPFNPDEILYSSDHKNLYKLNLKSFKSQFLHDFNQSIILISQKCIQTQQHIFYNYTSSSLKQKAQHNNKISYPVYKQLDLDKQQRMNYIVLDGPLGYIDRKDRDRFIKILIGQKKEQMLQVLIKQNGQVTGYLNNNRGKQEQKK